MRKFFIRRLERKVDRLEAQLRDQKAQRAEWSREIETRPRNEMGMEPSWIESAYAELRT